MPSAYKTLGQLDPAATTLTDLYTVPAATQAVVSTIVICNRSAVATSYRLSKAIAGAADATKQYLAYDTPIAGNSSQILTIGLAMAATDKLRAYATLATLSFNADGVEIT